MKQTLLFRFDASTQIGIGHAFRCMALIEQFSLNKELQIVVMSQRLPTFIVNTLQGYGALLLGLQEQLSESEQITRVVQIAFSYSANTLVIDGYHFSSHYREQLYRSGLQVIAFDDCNDLSHLYCHLVINALPFAHRLGYEKSASNALKLFGLDYSIIRAEYLQAAKQDSQIKDKLLINFGGSDVAGLTVPVIKLLIQLELAIDPEKVLVVTGGAYQQPELVTALCEEAGFTHIHQCENMAQVVAQCKMAICAPGSIVYELAFMGVVSLFLTVADNQRLSAQAHQDLGWCYMANGLEMQQVQQLIEQLPRLWSEQHQLQSMSDKARQLIDGKGVKRICQVIWDEFLCK